MEKLYRHSCNAYQHGSETRVPVKIQSAGTRGLARIRCPSADPPRKRRISRADIKFSFPLAGCGIRVTGRQRVSLFEISFRFRQLCQSLHSFFPRETRFFNARTAAPRVLINRLLCSRLPTHGQFREFVLTRTVLIPTLPRPCCFTVDLFSFRLRCIRR